jgi:two-component system chemotaxis response regulator CheY
MQAALIGRSCYVFDSRHLDVALAASCCAGWGRRFILAALSESGIRFMAKRVLIVDDAATMRKIILRLLAAMGPFEVIEAADGDDALSLFQASRFDLVLTNWNMPGRDGLSLVREIRRVNRSVPVIMVTTESEKSRVLQAIEAGVSDYIVKPFTADTLQQKVRRFCGTVPLAATVTSSDESDV